MQTTQEFLSHLRELGVELTVDGDRLRCTAPKGVFTPSLRSMLADHRVAMLAVLRQPSVDAAFWLEPIRPVSGSNHLPLSFAQQRLWFLDQLEGPNCTYNVAASLSMEGELDVAALERSLTEIVRRHEPLRTVFSTADGSPIQVVLPGFDVALPVVDLQTLPDAVRSAETRRLAIEDASRPFDLTRDPQLRLTLIRLGPKSHVLLRTMHHIMCDGWSIAVFNRELAALYEAFMAGLPSPLPDLPIQYSDYARWQREWLNSTNVLNDQLTYWKKQLDGANFQLQIPSSQLRPHAHAQSGGAARFVLKKVLTEGLKDLARQEEVTLFMLVLAAFKVFLHGYRKQDDIVVGTDAAGRSRKETESLIGFFVNVLVLRTALSGDPSFRELLQRVRKVAIEAFAHQDLPFEKVVEIQRPRRNGSHVPLVGVLFVFESAPLRSFKLPNLTLSPLKSDPRSAKFDLVLFVEDTGQEITGMWNYRTGMFDGATIEKMSREFEAIIADVVKQPDARLSELEMHCGNGSKLANMEKSERRSVTVERLKNVRRKGVELSQTNLTKSEFLQPDQTLPLVVRPAVDAIDPEGWVRSNREFIEEKLPAHGAILFRGFRIESALSFERFSLAICSQLLREYGDLPREGLSESIFSSTPYPADKVILFHNESSHLSRWPMKILFCCLKAAQQGGVTPIVDCRQVHKLLDPAITEKFERKGLIYIRNFKRGLDVSWETFFGTSDRSVVEGLCRASGMEFEWKTGDELRIQKARPAVARHPGTGERVFFNQLMLHHSSCLEPAERASLLSLFREEDMPRNIYYGDRTPIEDSVVAEIRRVYDRLAVAFPWEEGDVLLLDNVLTAHGRGTFSGPRKIAVAMGDVIEEKAFQGGRDGQ